jgi:hypothetical protein
MFIVLIIVSIMLFMIAPKTTHIIACTLNAFFAMIISAGFAFMITMLTNMHFYVAFPICMFILYWTWNTLVTDW